jgi:prophage regulatory protein
MTNNKHFDDNFLRIEEVLKIIPISRATLYRIAKKEKLLKPLKVGGSSFWSLNNINYYFDNLKQKNLLA